MRATGTRTESSTRSDRAKSDPSPGDLCRNPTRGGGRVSRAGVPAHSARSQIRAAACRLSVARQPPPMRTTSSPESSLTASATKRPNSSLFENRTPMSPSMSGPRIAWKPIRTRMAPNLATSVDACTSLALGMWRFLVRGARRTGHDSSMDQPAAQVAGPTTPSTPRFAAAWSPRVARSVWGPNEPSAAPTTVHPRESNWFCQA